MVCSLVDVCRIARYSQTMTGAGAGSCLRLSYLPNSRVARYKVNSIADTALNF
jgi:hypothetical protein